MISAELQTAKEELVTLMLELRSKDYVIGWLAQAYVDPRPDVVDKVALRVLKQLREEKAKK